MLFDDLREIVESAGDCEGEKEEAQSEAQVALFVVRSGVDWELDVAYHQWQDPHRELLSRAA